MVCYDCGRTKEISEKRTCPYCEAPMRVVMPTAEYNAKEIKRLREIMHTIYFNQVSGAYIDWNPVGIIAEEVHKEKGLK